MRKLLAIFTFIFTFTHAFAYGPVDQSQLDENLDLVTLSKPMSERKFKRLQKRALKQNNKLIEKVSKLSNEEQTKFAVKELENKNEDAVKSAKKILKSKILMKKYKKVMIAKLPTISESEIQASLQDIIDGRALDELKANLMDKIEKAGSYINVLNEKKSLIENAQRVQKVTEQLSEVKSSGEEVLVTILMIIVVAFIACIIVGVVFLIKGIVAIASGALVPGLALICLSLYILGPIIIDL